MTDWPNSKTRAQFMQELATCWQMIEQLGQDNKRLREENERLQAECLRLSHAEAEAMAVALSQEGQTERLRDQVTRLSTLVDTERGLRDAEIERLRNERSIAETRFAMYGELLFEKALEIERLEEMNTALIAAKTIEIVPPPISESFVIETLQKTIASLHSDIARLRNSRR